MNRLKVIEWLLENDCPFDFDVQDSYWETNSCTLVFTDQEEKDL